MEKILKKIWTFLFAIYYSIKYLYMTKDMMDRKIIMDKVTIMARMETTVKISIILAGNKMFKRQGNLPFVKLFI